MRFIRMQLPGSKLKLVISTIGVLALILFASIIVFEMTKKEVNLTIDGEEKIIKTHKNTVKELLAEENITASEHDEISHSLDAEIEDGMTINYDVAKKVKLDIDGKTNTYYSTAQNVEEFLEKENIGISEHDEISLNIKDEIEDGQYIQIKKAFEVVIEDGGKSKTAFVTGGTVEDLLKENNIRLDKDDKVTPQLDKKLEKGAFIEIVRVEKKVEEVVEDIAFDTETKEDASLEKGKQKVITEGKKGKIRKTYQVTYENGQKVDRELLDEEVQEEKVNRIVAVGTKEPKQQVATLSAKSGTSTKSSGGKTLTMKASAFTASCSGCSGYTATGINLKANPNKKVIAVDPSVIPLGTRVWVEGYGEAIAGDTGGNIKGNRIDIHVPNKATAKNWGVRNVQVKILD